MDDFNRIAYVVKNYGKLKGLIFFAFALLYSTQIISPFRIPALYDDFFLPFLIVTFCVPFVFMGLAFLYYKKSVGVITNYPYKLGKNKTLLLVALSIAAFAACFVTISYQGMNYLLGFFWVAILLLFPDLKENWTYRRYIFAVGACILLIGFIPFGQVFSFQYDFAEMGLKMGLFVTLFYIPTGIFDHFLLLKLMQPIRAESIKNSLATLDPILGDPANLTILAALSNCQNADFVFLRKISHLEETEFYRRIYGLENGGLIYTFQLPNGIYKNKRAVAITPQGWEIVTQIYNDTIPGHALPDPFATLA
jgi:hypothetical protein